MKRRTALRSIALGVSSFATLPTWAASWNSEKLPITPAFTNDNYLNELAETLIPTTDTPGAGSLGVGKFIKAMINDCTGESDKTIFMKQLASIDELSQSQFSKNFINLSSEEKKTLLEGMATQANADWQLFFKILKRYTIQGYMNSEDVLTRQGFEFAPGRYLGCVNV